MKIIKPIDDVDTLSSSDAPADALDVWAPIGRDLLNYVAAPLFDIAGNILYAVSSTGGGDIYVVDLDTGVVASLGVSLEGVVINLKVSPDGAYVMTQGYKTTTSYEVITNLFDTSDGSNVYSKTGADIVYGRNVKDAIYWDGSTDVFFGSGYDLVKITIATLTETVLAYDWPRYAISVTSDGTNLYVVGHVNSPNPPANRNRISIFSKAGTLIDSVYDLGRDIEYIRINPTTNDLLAFDKTTKKIRLFNKTTLVEGAAPVNLSGSVFTDKAQSIAITTTHLITRSLSSAPYWNYRLLTDYSLDKSLPTLPYKGEGIAVGDDFTVVQQPSGIALIDNTDDSIISQTNPSVLVGDEYVYEDNIYEVLIDNTDEPDTGSTLAVPTWLDKGNINQLRMFDGKLDSLTTSNDDLSIDIMPNSVVSGLALFNVKSRSLQITMTDPIDGVVFDTGEVSMLDDSLVTDWFNFFFSPYVSKKDYATLSLPPYPDATIHIEINNDGSGTAIGEVVIGRIYNIGESQYNTSVGILDYSRKEQDEFGNFNIIQRKFTKRADYDVKVMTNSISGVQRTLANLRATPAVFVGDVSREETIIYGFYRSFDIVISSPSISDATITVEGL